MAAQDVAYGPMPGKVTLLPQYANIVPQGQPRPLGVGEFIRNQRPDGSEGSWSSEITTTLNDPRLNAGRPSVIPTVWLINGQPHRVTEDQALELAVKSGLQFPGFDNADLAEKWSGGRESSWQEIANPADTSSWSHYPQLWQQAAPTPINDYHANVMGLLARQLQR